MSLTGAGERETSFATLHGMWNSLIDLATQKDVMFSFSSLPGSEINKQSNPLKRKDQVFIEAKKNARLDKFNESRAFELNTSNKYNPLIDLNEENQNDMDAEITSGPNKITAYSSKVTLLKTKTEWSPSQ